MSDSSSFHFEDLIDRLLLIVTLNSTLVHFLLSSQVEGSVDPDRVDSLTQGLLRTRKWMEEATTMKGIPPSTQNILTLIVKRLSQIESLLPKLSEKAKQAEVNPATEILSFLEGEGRTTPEAAGEAAAPSAQGEVIPLVGETAAATKPLEAYKKVDVEDDQFGLIGQTQRLIQQYSKRCHVLLPTFWLEVIREIHRYRSDSPYLGDVVELPARMLVKITKGLLTEAPGARLLQDLMKSRQQENYLSASEMERIERAVAKYYQGLEGVLKEQKVNINDKILEAQTALDGFGWGGPELEKRIIKRLNQQCVEALESAESASDQARQVIYAEITKLLCKLQHAILAEPRTREILAQMKP
ncbi:MAG: hypothetical protein DRO87_05850 [Candidatus Thorarchaeota archaeon]|nr:MAG: hypothetical protein DRP09_00265 [Candidatus Thorarchaeota archaeon]RLI58390.1 MAG: hypothetical protein DRO87_05850 [Candidatus Thorarchaeota archaeon]